MGMSEKEIKEVNEEKIEKKKESKPSWVKIKKEDLEKIIIGLAKEGKSPAAIGLILRDKHGIPKTKLFGMRVCEILDEKGIEYKTERNITDERILKLKSHITNNKHDHPASRALTKKLWVLRKLAE
jgi:small subunit ribosomal protein S15